MKYVIEIEDEPFGRNDDPNIPHGMDELYMAKGFNSLVFDQFGLDKLMPLDEALEEVYQKGIHDGSLDVKERVDGAYHKGFEAGSHEATTLEYQQGLNDAWDVAKRIVLTKTCANCPYFTVAELEKIFGCSSSQSVFDTYSASEAIEKVKAHEQQKAGAEIKVGDEVTLKSNDSNCLGVVVRVDDTNAILMTRDGYTTMYRLEILKKTNKHFPQMAELLKAMKDSGVTK